MNASTKAQSETSTNGTLAEIRSFAKLETTTRKHVRTLAERIETGLITAMEALESAGAARVPSSATYGVALAHVTAEVWANPAWTRAKSGESGADERAAEARESADFAASQVLMNVAPAHQAPYRAEVVIRSAGAIVHADSRRSSSGALTAAPRRGAEWVCRGRERDGPGRGDSAGRAAKYLWNSLYPYSTDVIIHTHFTINLVGLQPVYPRTMATTHAREASRTSLGDSNECFVGSWRNRREEGTAELPVGSVVGALRTKASRSAGGTCASNLRGKLS